MYFQESQSDDAAHGWYCTCGYRILARPTKQSTAEVRRVLTERRVKAFRKSMKVQARAHRLIKNSERIAARKK
jgi:DNA-directed RNA polymerase subunit RPC12/RpoP